MDVSTNYKIDETDLCIRVEVHSDDDYNVDWVYINLVELGDAIDAARKAKEPTQ